MARLWKRQFPNSSDRLRHHPALPTAPWRQRSGFDVCYLKHPSVRKAHPTIMSHHTAMHRSATNENPRSRRKAPDHPQSQFVRVVEHGCSSQPRAALSEGLRRFGLRVLSQFVPEHSLRIARERAIPKAPLAERTLPGASRRNIEHRGRPIAVHEWGEPGRPRILLAHDWTGDSAAFAHWILPLVNEGYAVTAFDQPGRGESVGSSMPCDFVDSLRAVAMTMEPIDAIIAHGHGALAATLLLAEHPVAARVVLIAPPADPYASVVRFGRNLGLSDGLAKRFAGIDQDSFAGGQPPLSPPRMATAIGCSALIVHDLCDQVVPSIEGESYARHWRGSRMLTTTGLSHESIVASTHVIESTLQFLRGDQVGDRVIASPEIDSLLGLH